MVCFFFHNRVICKTVVSALSIVGWVEDYKLSKRLVLAVRTMCVEPPHDMCLPFVCYNEGLLCLIYDRGYV